MSRRDADVVIVGGGHNGLVAAAYLARAGRSVVVCEARDTLGGAVAGEEVFTGVSARLSRFSYLVSLLPERIVGDLGLPIGLRSRPVASYSPGPDGSAGLLVRRDDEATAASFRAFGRGGSDLRGWRELYRLMGGVAEVLAPTLTGPLPRASDLRTRIGDEVWRAVTERPIGELIEAHLSDDLVRGTVLTDALIGTETEAHDPSLRQNRCFLYHLIGNGTGEWKVPVGGMGAVADALARAAWSAGATVWTDAAVQSLDGDGRSWRVRLADGRDLSAPVVLANCAPTVLGQLLGETGAQPGAAPAEGNQLKVNLLLRRLPAFRSGVDPRVGFAGTLHLNQGYAQLAAAHRAAEDGRLPDPLPCETYCHTLTDDSILAPALRADGWQTLTLFGLHTPAALFRSDPDGMRDRATAAALASLQSVLAEPIEDCLAIDAAGRPCLEAMTPLDLEAELTLPGGHIFHGDLSWPWLTDDEPATTPAERWGCATDLPGLLICGSGSRRGGAVSGLGGHSAAMAVLESAGSGRR